MRSRFELALANAPLLGRSGLQGVNVASGLNAAQAVLALNPLLWIRADKGAYSDTSGTIVATDGQGVGSIRDQSANGYLLVQPSAGARATFQANTGPSGQPSLYFAGAQTYPLPAGLSVTTQAVSLFSVQRFRNFASTNPAVILGIGSGANNLYWYQTVRNPYVNAGGTITGWASPTPGLQGPFMQDPPFQYHQFDSVLSAVATVHAYDSTSPFANTATSTAPAPPNVTCSGGYLGSLAGTSDYLAANVTDILLFGTALSPANALVVRNALKTLRQPYNRLSSLPYNVVQDGDSITFGKGSDSTIDGDWSSLLKTALAANYQVWNFGISNQTLTQAITAASGRVDPFYSVTKTKNVLTCWLGSNDYAAGVSGAAMYTNLQTYGNARGTAGFRRIVATTMTRTDYTGAMQTQRGIGNGNLRSDFNVATGNAYVFKPGGGVTYFDALVDMDALQVAIGGTFIDGIHPTAAFDAAIAPVWQYAIQLF
jgi:hypothetical protein